MRKKKKFDRLFHFVHNSLFDLSFFTKGHQIEFDLKGIMGINFEHLDKIKNSREKVKVSLDFVVNSAQNCKPRNLSSRLKFKLGKKDQLISEVGDKIRIEVSLRDIRVLYSQYSKLSLKI